MTAEDRINELEAQITVLRARQDELKKQLAQAEVDRWQGRIDDLELQVHLGAMETSERVKTLLEQLRRRWAEAKAQYEVTSEAATEGAGAVGESFRKAFKDLKQAMIETKHRVAS